MFFLLNNQTLVHHLLKNETKTVKNAAGNDEVRVKNYTEIQMTGEIEYYTDFESQLGAGLIGVLLYILIIVMIYYAKQAL